MTYYQILKQRRLDLKLSIQDVSNQTRLAPEYIQAIEENQLDIFANDFSFVRYFVQAYCQAIGVNWQAIQLEVDQTIQYYAHQKNMALTQAQKNLAQNMEYVSAQPPKRRDKTKTKSNSHYQSSVTRTSRKLHWSKRRLSKVGVVFLVAVLAFLFASNLVINSIATRQQRIEEENRQQELIDKEQETQRLAEEKKKQEYEKLNRDLKFIQDEKDYNFYQVYTGSKKQCEFEFKVKLPKKSNVVLYKNDELVTLDFNKVYSKEFVYRVKVDENCILRLKIDNYDKNKIKINDHELSFNEHEWQKGDPAEMEFNIILDEAPEPEPVEETYYEQIYEDEVYYDDTYYGYE